MNSRLNISKNSVHRPQFLSSAVYIRLFLSFFSSLSVLETSIDQLYKRIHLPHVEARKKERRFAITCLPRKITVYIRFFLLATVDLTKIIKHGRYQCSIRWSSLRFNSKIRRSSSHQRWFSKFTIKRTKMGRTNGKKRKTTISVFKFVFSKVQLCTPRGVYICDGSEEEADMVTHKLLERGTLTRLTKYENNYICWTDPRVSW